MWATRELKTSPSLTTASQDVMHNTEDSDLEWYLMGQTIYLDPIYPTMLTELGATQGIFKHSNTLFFFILFLMCMAQRLDDHWHGLDHTRI